MQCFGHHSFGPRSSCHELNATSLNVLQALSQSNNFISCAQINLSRQSMKVSRVTCSTVALVLTPLLSANVLAKRNGGKNTARQIQLLALRCSAGFTLVLTFWSKPVAAYTCSNDLSLRKHTHTFLHPIHRYMIVGGKRGNLRVTRKRRIKHTQYLLKALQGKQFMLGYETRNIYTHLLPKASKVVNCC